MPNLPISRLVKVSVDLAPRAAQAQDLSTLLVLGSSTVIDVVERLRTYSSLDAVADDFGNAAPEYLCAALWFGQNPSPFQIKIGRWVLSDSSGQLIGGALPNSSKSIAMWNTILAGGFQLTVNGINQILNNLNFGAVTTLNGVAGVINAAIAGAVCSYDAVAGRFIFTSNTTGVGSAIGFLSAAGGVDISSLLGGAEVDGAYVADGVAAETAVAAATLFNANFGQTWYALTMPTATDDDHLAVAAFIEGTNNKHLYGVSTEEAGVLSAAVVTDIAYKLSQLGYRRTIVQYSSSNAYSVCSLLGRALTVDYNGNSTVIILMFKQEPGIDAESVTESQIDALEAKKCNIFVEYNNSTSIIEPGVMSSGNFIDEITGTDWLAVDVMTALYNLLYTSTTKIPQTDAGAHLLVNAIEAVCVQGVTNGLLAEGVWNSGGFGILKQGDFLSKGFYVYAPPLASQSQADRDARKSVPIKVAAKLAGGVQSVDVIIEVNR